MFHLKWIWLSFWFKDKIIVNIFILPSPLLPPTTSTTLHHDGWWTNLCLSNTCLASELYNPPSSFKACFPPSQADNRHRSSSSAASQPGEIEMLSAETTGPLIKFPRLVPVDSLIALSNWVLQRRPALRRATSKKEKIELSSLLNSKHTHLKNVFKKGERTGPDHNSNMFCWWG